MTKKAETRIKWERWTWLVWGFLVGLILFLLTIFGRVWSTNQALRRELSTLEPVISAALEEQRTLEARVTYVQSEAYVAEWSQANAGMTKPGETLVEVIQHTPTPTATPTPTITPTPTPTRAPFWERLFKK
jgi:cell division protein FtsB